MANTMTNSRMRLEMARKEAADASRTWVILRRLCRTHECGVLLVVLMSMFLP